jgi:integrase/recombinase XerD
MWVIFVDIPPGMVPVGLEEKEASDAGIRAVCDPVPGAGGVRVVRLGQPLLDDYLGFLSGRCRPNTVLAVAFDGLLHGRGQASEAGPAGRCAWVHDRAAHRRDDRGKRVRAVDADQVGVSTRTLRRRLSSISGLYGFLQLRGDVATNPVPRGLPTRIERQRPHQGVRLVRGTRTLPRILTPTEVDALTGALRTHRDRAMVAAMVLGGLRRCEVVGLRLGDLRVAERRVFIADGKGGHQRRACQGFCVSGRSVFTGRARFAGGRQGQDGRGLASSWW